MICNQSVISNYRGLGVLLHKRTADITQKS